MADANFIDASLLSRIENTGAKVITENLKPPRQFNLAAAAPDGSQPKLVCSKAITVDVEVHIRHGTGLVLRGSRWLVSEQRVPEPLLGRPVLEFLGLNTPEIFHSAAERYNGSVDVGHIRQLDESGEGHIARIMEGVFHTDGDAPDSSDDDNESGWCDLGPESDEGWNEALSERVQEAKDNGISTEGADRLHKMLRLHRDVVRIRLDRRPPAKVEPLRIHLKPNSTPVRAKPRKYPRQKKEFLRKYVSKLLDMNLVKAAVRTDWVAAPLIVPKKPPTMFRLTMDYRPVNAATVKTAWPMPHIDASLAEIGGATLFAGIDFCSGYWQLPLHGDSQHYHAFMTVNGIVQPMRTTQGG